MSGPQTVVPDDAELAALRRLAARLATTAGDLIRQGQPGTVQVASKSSPTDVVTEMDRASEELLVREIRAARPDDGILGEEGGPRPGRSGLTWVVDPIDGTVNYLYGIPAYAVSVALVCGPPRPESWQVVAAAVANPVSGELWTAHLGGGASLAEVPIRVNPSPRPEAALVGTGFGYRSEVRRAQAAVVAELLPDVRDIRRAGAASLDLCAVACGRLDGYYERGLQPWDLAAGCLIVSEAGGAVGGLNGDPAGEQMTIAAPGPLHEWLRGRLRGLLT